MAPSCVCSLDASKSLCSHSNWRSKGRRDVLWALPHWARFVTRFTATGSWGTDFIIRHKWDVYYWILFFVRVFAFWIFYKNFNEYIGYLWCCPHLLFCYRQPLRKYIFKWRLTSSVVVFFCLFQHENIWTLFYLYFFFTMITTIHKQ